MSFFRFYPLRKFSEIALWLRISRVSQLKKNAVPQIRKENWAILEQLQDLANSKPTFHSTQKSKSLFQKNLTISLISPNKK
jgi:hypothetical protein